MPGVLAWGYDPDADEWRPIKVSPTGALYMIETVDALDDIGDVNAPAPADNESLTWDAATSKWIPEAVTPGAHAASHQDGGADEISVAGLSGLLADDQHVLDAEVLLVAAALVHATRHQNGGADEISVAGLSGLLADDQHVLDAEVLAVAAALVHATRHQNGGADEISVAGLSGELADNQPPKAHKTSHENGGGDEISLAGLSGDPADTINKSLLTTRGDIIRRGAAAPERLGIATDGKIFKSDGTDPGWTDDLASITFIIDGGGSAITTGEKGHLEIPFSCTILQCTLLADQTGSIVIDIWKALYANFPPTDADSITAAAPPTISSAQKSQDSTLFGWTTSIGPGDILAFNVDSCSTIERVTLSLKVKKVWPAG